MIEYNKDITRAVRKGLIPDKVFLQVHHCFEAIEKVGDMSIFDVKKVKGDFQNTYYRLRNGNYRAIFHFEDGNIKVAALEHRSEVYKKWES